MDNLTIVMAEFGPNINLEPSLSSFRKYFGNDTKVILYTNNRSFERNDIEAIYIDPSIHFKDVYNKRINNRLNDLYKAIGLIYSQTEYAIAIDSDMQIVSADVLHLIPLTKRFGMCLPANPRNLVKIDNMIGADGQVKFDNTYVNNMYITNMSPITFYNDNIGARTLLTNYINNMRVNPSRGPVMMAKSIYETTDFNPYILPLNWCVCQENIGIGNEIILHIGHQKVKKYYEDLIGRR